MGTAPNETSRCARCGSPYLAAATGGLCPQCVGRQILSLNGHGEDMASRPAALMRLGDYELLDKIAEGGMGVVFKARDVKLDRLVALKMVRAGQFAAEAEIKRFRTEAEAAAQLTHPNIVPIYEVGEEEGHHYFSMKLIEGQPLSALIKGGCWFSQYCPEHCHSIRFIPGRRGCCATAAAVMAKVARAVHYAHQRGILHRDLKPGNILMDRQGEPHVADFGLAKRIESPSDLTISGQVIGSPSYMAPEQAAGQMKQLTTAADIYSLGAVLFELLAGQPPFKAATPLETMRLVMESEPPQPTAINPRADRDLEVICLKCLEKDPARRYGSAEALAMDLERWLANEPILARPAGAMEKLWLWCRRQPTVASLSAAVGLLLLVVTVGSPIAALRIEEGRRSARQAAHAAEGELWKSLHSQARLGLASREQGFRQRGLTAIAKAAVLRPTVELRDAAISHLVSLDFEDDGGEVPLPGDALVTGVSPDLNRYVLSFGGTDAPWSLRRWPDHAELFRLALGPRARLWITPNSNILLMATNTAYQIVDLEQNRTLFARSYGRSVLFNDDGCFDFSPNGRLAAWITPAKLDGPPHLNVVIADLNLAAVTARFSVDAPEPLLAAVRLHREIKLDSTGTHVAVVAGTVVEVRAWEAGRIVARFTNEVAWDQLDWQRDLLAMRDARGLVRVWNARSRQSSLFFVPRNGRMLLSPNADWLLQCDRRTSDTSLLNPQTGMVLLTMRSRMPFGFDHSQARLAYRQRRNCAFMRVVRPAGLRTIRTDHTVRQFDFSPDGRWLASVSSDGLEVFDVDSGALLARTNGNLGSCRFRAGSKTLLAGGSTTKLTQVPLQQWPLEFLDSPTGRVVRFGHVQPLVVPQARFSGFPSLSLDRKWAALPEVPSGQRGYLLDLDRPEQAQILTNINYAGLLAVSPDHRWVATASHLFDAKTGKELRRLNRSGRPLAAEFSPDGRWLATTYDDNSLRVYRTDTWEIAARLHTNGPPSTVSADLFRTAFSRDSLLLAKPSDDRLRLDLFETATWSRVATLTPPEPAWIKWFEFSPTEDLLAISTDQSELQLWDIAKLRRELRALKLDWDSPNQRVVSPL